jgi:hypothetical protein
MGQWCSEEEAVGSCELMAKHWCRCRKHEELFDQAVEVIGSKKFEQQKDYVQDEVAKQVCGDTANGAAKPC